STIPPIFVVYNSFHRIVLPLCADTMHARPQAALSAGAPAACPRQACHHGGSRCRASVAVSQRRDGVSAAEDFAQSRFRFCDDIQPDYEVIRPLVLFAETIAARSRQTGIEPTVVGAKARRFAMEGMLGLVDQRLVNPGRKGHVYPEAVAARIVYVKQLYPPLDGQE